MEQQESVEDLFGELSSICGTLSEGRQPVEYVTLSMKHQLIVMIYLT